MADMVMYYNCRKIIHELFNSNQDNNDLQCRLLEIRDKYRYVESVDVNMKNYSVEVELCEDIDEKKKDNIKKKVTDIIIKFVKENINDNDYNEYSTCIDNGTFCDTYEIGYSVIFNA